jgi:transcription factor SPN1
MTATRKLKMLSLVVTQLRKLDLREAFLDAGVLGVITDWLTRLPDGSLPHLQIRDNMLKILSEVFFTSLLFL